MQFKISKNYHVTPLCIAFRRLRGNQLPIYFYQDESIGIKIKKGLDLHIVGAVSDFSVVTECATSLVAITPDDFEGFVPKMAVKEGDHVLAGQPIMHHKLYEAIKLVSPAEGTVKAVVRGERRKTFTHLGHPVEGTAAVKCDVSGALKSADDAKALLMQTGLWAMMRQRPYDIVPDAKAEIRDVFVSGFDSAPLAYNAADYTPEQNKHMEAGVKLLQTITKGKVYVSRRKGQNLPDLAGAKMVDVAGRHRCR